MRPSISVDSVACLFCVGLLASFASALTVPADLVSNAPSTINNNDISSLQPRSVEEEYTLRIMPLGASITNGYRSTQHNGYRDWIRQQLRYKGWDVEMVGSLRNGTMIDNYNEGHFGYRVDQLPQKAELTIPKQPNLILINAGTNDALQKYKIRSVGSQMSSLIDLLFDQIPGTTVILSTLLPNKDQPTLVENINGQYRRLAAKRRADGDRLVLAEMSTFIKASELVDATHPDDAGYKKMASVWWAAIEVAFQENKIQNFNYTMTSVLEKSLDNSTSNPNLPSYTAPAQPTETSAASSQFSCPIMLALVMQLFVVFYFL
ncbi:hypothetical protein N7456_010199 [Penicillium angulare]|uniref:SGNH hydrolase-type esterase domain-containing protein n=1 Tax=Penicillium angulare TaxID=116970 RepID=A0A9W9F658_9EURO|nr:hypothetical protein N7456_010199 [Penicillium angulare]